MKDADWHEVQAIYFLNSHQPEYAQVHAIMALAAVMHHAVKVDEEYINNPTRSENEKS